MLIGSWTFTSESPQLFTSALFCAAVNVIGVVVYRIFFHPLAHIPGPLLAGVTSLYCYWYNARSGRLYLQIQKLHEQYGPVIRITPNEVHLSDPKNLEKIYSIGSRYGKHGDFYRAVGSERASLATESPEAHRIKRSAINPFFSRRKVLSLEEVVQGTAKKIVSRMQSAFETSGRLDLHYAFRAVSVDVITNYAFDESYKLLDAPDFGKEFFDVIRGFGPATLFFQTFPTIRYKPWGSMLQHQQNARNQVLRVKDAVDKGEKSKRTIFHHLLQLDDVEGYEPTIDFLADEAYIVLGAAADTTGNALTIATYNTVINPDIYKWLTAELTEAFPDPDADIDFTSLEKLPYLTGVIKEALRLSFGVPGRLPRVVPKGGAQFNGYAVPEGTIISMSAWTMHHSEEIFPDSYKFDPNRWTDPVVCKALDKYLFAFGKGSRQCVGMPLAYCELYVTLGRVLRQFGDLKTRKKSPEELVLNDYFSGYHPAEYADFIFERAV
ncbi:cytochrome P450 [Aspergillus ruber CBS 135680]|uniref:Cytochrome P450 n=1 Tax=Aspergillus ruber (strain CBS 135680) TaxID=1388766 RepID=A0A017S9S7_ASPRC|nr:cytochrome P450 [Aspergillus ruber CBS 135680]EYE93682.1 cytochrome P450 [Aspergillus ruber CBS 135680]